MPRWKQGDLIDFLWNQKGERIGRIFRGHLGKDEVEAIIQSPVSTKMLLSFGRNSMPNLFQKSVGLIGVIVLNDEPAQGSMEVTVLYDS